MRVYIVDVRSGSITRYSVTTVLEIIRVEYYCSKPHYRGESDTRINKHEDDGWWGGEGRCETRRFEYFENLLDRKKNPRRSLLGIRLSVFNAKNESKKAITDEYVYRVCVCVCVIGVLG